MSLPHQTSARALVHVDNQQRQPANADDASSFISPLPIESTVEFETVSVVQLLRDQLYQHCQCTAYVHQSLVQNARHLHHTNTIPANNFIIQTEMLRSNMYDTHDIIVPILL